MIERASKPSLMGDLMTTRLFAAIATTLLLFFVLPSDVRAWGCRGHQTIAFLAEKHLTPEAREVFQKVLAENPIDPKLKRYCGSAVAGNAFADASTWADDVRSERKNGPWHYIDIPRGKEHGSLEPYCGKDGCVTLAIEQQRAILHDKAADAVKRAEALRYIIHFVGDLHQPLHATNNADNGGNCVPVTYLHHAPLPNVSHPEREDYSPNLHQIWDTEIVERDMEVPDPRRFADELDEKSRPMQPAWQEAGIHIDGWAWESHDRAERIVYGGFAQKIEIEPNLQLASCSENNHMGRRMLEKHLVADEAYQGKAASEAEQALAEAGVRLAMILNEAAKAQ
jgi:nuclease S1